MEPDVQVPAVQLRKYRQAAWVFLAMNLAYVFLTWWKLPPLGLNYLEMAGFTALALALFGALSWGVYQGKRGLTLALAALYAGRSLFAAWTLWTGTAFPLVPWVLPTLVIAAGFLARAVWDRP